MRPLIVALDVPEESGALRLAKALSAYVDLFKVGPPLYLRAPQVLHKIQDLGKKVFLDLKFHDIPNTVQRSVEEAGRLGVYAVTLHVSGGPEMMRWAARVRQRPRLWGVTVLTSQDAQERRRMSLPGDPKTVVPKWAKLAKDSGLDGVVCSVQEARSVQKVCGKDFVTVTPGIRLSRDSHQDQKRVASPAQALEQGAHFFVVGRPIVEAENPIAIVEEIYEQIENKV